MICKIAAIIANHWQFGIVAHIESHSAIKDTIFIMFFYS